MRLITTLRMYHFCYSFDYQGSTVEVTCIISPKKQSPSNKGFERSFLSLLLLSLPATKFQKKMGTETHGKCHGELIFTKHESMCSKQILVSSEYKYKLRIQILMLICKVTNLYIQWKNYVETD